MSKQRNRKAGDAKYLAKNPFFAARVPKRLLVAFKAYARKQKTTAAQLVVGFMASATGVEP